MISIKIPQKEGRKILNFSQELPKDKSFQTLSSAIHLEGWGKHFEYEYSQTCIRRPLLGPLKNGRLGQVVVLWNTFIKRSQAKSGPFVDELFEGFA